jgi:hypothetical protein
MLQAYFQSLVTNKQKSSGLNPEYIVWMQYWHYMAVSLWKILKQK